MSTQIKARKLLPFDHPLIGDIIADSFSDDPVNLWVFGSTKPLQRYYTLAAKKLYLKKGYGHVMQDGSGGALWLPPGTSKQIPLWNSLDIAWTMTKADGLSAIARGIKIDSFLARKKPQTPHYYLFTIGARQASQGKGAGSALMREGLRKVDENKFPAYLESSKESNTPYYQRFGFEVIERVEPAKGCPPLWLMWREAR
mgnify:FL=1